MNKQIIISISIHKNFDKMNIDLTILTSELIENYENSSPYSDFFNRICNRDNIININNLTINYNNIININNEIINDNDIYGIQNVMRIINFDNTITNNELDVDDDIIIREQNSNQLIPIDLNNLHQLYGLYECCSICLEQYKQNSQDTNVCMLNCSHHFHINCLSQWLVSQHTCPLCRTSI